jgi:flavin-binding protein dodecin
VTNTVRELLKIGCFRTGHAKNYTGSITIHIRKERKMSVYKVIQIVGTSSESWEKAAAEAMNMASKSLRDLRIAEVDKLDVQMEDGKIKAYRAKLNVSFKYHGEE